MTAWTGQLDWNRRVGTGQPCQDSGECILDRTAGIGLSGQGSLTGQSGQDRLARTSIGQLGQDKRDRKTMAG
jgi:hypothetical protein